MPKFSMKVMWSDEDGGFIATCPELPGVSAGGATPEDAISELQVAMELAIETFEAKGWPLPEPNLEQPFSGQFRLRVPKSLHRWLSERAEMEHVSLNSLVIELLSRTRGGAEVGAIASEEVRRTLTEMQSTLLSSIVTAIRVAAENTEGFIERPRSPGWAYDFGTLRESGGIYGSFTPRREEEAWQSSYGR